jgi:hypothetical protein
MRIVSKLHTLTLVAVVLPALRHSSVRIPGKHIVLLLPLGGFKG